MFCRRPITGSFLKSGLIRSLPPRPISSRLQGVPCSSVPFRQYSSHRPNYHRFNETRDLWRTSQQFRIGVTLVSGCIVIWIGSNMERAPVTGRWRFVCVSEEYETELGKISYQDVMQDCHGRILRPDDPRHQMVGRVLERLLPNSGLKGDVEFHVIDDHEENAFVIPGNKIFVFSGILPICNNEDGLASILGHEIAHNVAHHVQENASLPYLMTLILGLVMFFIDNSAQLTQLVLNYGLELPNSRAQETEADYLGLLMMAQSCYNPEEAIKVWDRMAKANKSAVPQFISTHPTDRNRLNRFQQWLPEAVEKQTQSQCGQMTQYSNEFQQALASHTSQDRPMPERDNDNDNDNDFW